jgi:hypothetical protein
LTSWPTSIGTTQSLDIFAYCFSDFNDNIIRNLKLSTAQITIRNLNRFPSIAILEESFNLHPVSIAYKMDIQDSNIEISPRFNNKTAYYNLQTNVLVGTQSKDMVYKDSFLNFGYSPTYNILDYLEKVEPSRFLPSHRFSVMPEFFSLPSSNIFGSSVIYSDFTVGQITGTSSYYRFGTNQIIFGENLKFYWDALFLSTFINLKVISALHGEYTTTKLLITKKYYNSNLNGYVMEFNKKIEIPDVVANLSWSSFSIDLVSRNSLELISQDLQTLNNIQRTSTVKSVQYLQTFTKKHVLMIYYYKIVL